MHWVEDLLIAYKVTAYFCGHKHSLQLSEIGDTLFVLSGSASKDKQPFKSWMKGGPGKEIFGVTGVLGYVHAKLNSNGFNVDYLNANNNIIHTSRIVGPRSPIINEITIAFDAKRKKAPKGDEVDDDDFTNQIDALKIDPKILAHQFQNKRDGSEELQIVTVEGQGKPEKDQRTLRRRRR